MRENEEREQKRKNRKFITGVHIQKLRTNKPTLKTKKKTKDELTEDEKDLRKYLGTEFFEEMKIA